MPEFVQCINALPVGEDENGEPLPPDVDTDTLARLSSRIDSVAYLRQLFEVQ